MKTYVKALQADRWCVDHEGRDVSPGSIIGFTDPRAAQYFVDGGRAVLLGLFANDAAARTKASFVGQAPKPSPQSVTVLVPSAAADVSAVVVTPPSAGPSDVITATIADGGAESSASETASAPTRGRKRGK